MIFQIPPRTPHGREQVAFWEDFLTPDEINFILARPEWLNAQAGRVGGDANINADGAVRKSEVSWLELNQDTVLLWKKITDVVAEVNNRYFKYDLTGCYEPMQLGVYSEHNKGHYNWHTDSGGNVAYAPRKLSMALLLSDPSTFEGGQLQVKLTDDEPINLEQKLGRAWFFPSYALHRVTPVTKGIRRSLVLWVGGPDFK